MQSTGLTLNQVELTPTITAAAYSSGKQVGGIQTIPGVCLDQNRFAQLINVTLTDADKQSAAMTIFFFDVSPTVTSVDTGSMAMTAANLALQCIGHVAIAAGDYQPMAAVSVASKDFDLKYLKTRHEAANLYAIAMTTGTPTYATTTSLKFKYVFAKHF